MLFNEPKLLKSNERYERHYYEYRFSALQRAEIAEIPPPLAAHPALDGFSALQRAEIAEM